MELIIRSPEASATVKSALLKLISLIPFVVDIFNTFDFGICSIMSFNLHVLTIPHLALLFG